MKLRTPRPITVALEGGGALGAFTWGVLERLLDTPTISIEVVSGASAGAMNAAIVAQGLAIGGPLEAKRQLEAFWRRIAADASVPTLSLGRIAVARQLMAPVMRSMLQSSAMPAPTGSFNPLRALVADMLDPVALCRHEAPRIVVSATCVRTGKPELFTNEEISVDVLLASACLPTFFAPVVIEGEAYWDGAFSSNPPLRPLIEAGAPSDVIIVRTAPLERAVLPRTGLEVQDRAIEIAFGAALRNELRSLAVAQRLLRHVPILSTALRRLRNARIHAIGADDEMTSLPSGSHLDTTWSFLSRMRTLGNETAAAWLETKLDAVGRISTVPASLYEGARLPDLLWPSRNL